MEKIIFELQYSYNVIKKIYDKCKEQKHKKETTVAASENDSLYAADYDKGTFFFLYKQDDLALIEAAYNYQKRIYEKRIIDFD